MKKAICLLISITLIFCTILQFPFQVNAADWTSGMTFQKNGAVYQIEQIPSEEIATLEFWVRFPNWSASLPGGVALGSLGLDLPGFSVEFPAGGAPRLLWTEANGTTHDWVFEGANVFSSGWEHIAIVHDRTVQKAYCYQNGVLVSTVDTGDCGSIQTSAPMILGGDHRSGDDQRFRGQLRTAVLFTQPRTAEQIAADMGIPSGDSLLMYLDAANSASVDKSGNGYHASTDYWNYDPAPAEDYAYSFMAMGDTQMGNERNPEAMAIIYDYVLDNLEEKNVQFVIGLGDITDDDTDREWTTAAEQIHRMDGKVNYSLVRGNHDSRESFCHTFSYAEYANTLGGTYGDNILNTWQTFQVGKIKYLVFSLDFGPADPVLDWASQIIEDHPDHNVIITTHAYLNADGSLMSDAIRTAPTNCGGYNNGDHLWDKFVRKHKNIVLVLCGHDPYDYVRAVQSTGDHGNTITQLLIDGQGVDLAQNGMGLVATLYFSEDGRNLTIDYYSTIKKTHLMAENLTLTMDVVEVSDTPFADDLVPDNTDTGIFDFSNPLLITTLAVAVVALAAVIAVIVIIMKKRK